MLKKFLFILSIPLLSFSQLTPCEQAVEDATGLIGEFVPQCEDDGSYAPMQCWASTGYCWCVDEDGVEISGTSIPSWEGIPNCAEEIDSLNVLFLGNSYTASNNLPNIVSNIANSMGDFLFAESNTIGAGTLQMHVDNSNSNNLIGMGDWDYVVLQEQSQYPSFPLWQVEQSVFPYASQLSQLVQEYNNCAETVFFMTWGRENGDTNNCANWPPVCTYEGMDDLLHERYLMMANQNEALVSPVGAVWRHIRDNNYNFALYSSDGSHPSALGSYVAGICFYTTLFQKDPTNIPWNGNDNWNISDTDASIIKQIVKSVVYDNFTNWNIVPTDIDNDGVCNNLDNCPDTYNPEQVDFNLNDVGDECEDNINPCQLLPETGECDAAFQIFYFNQNTLTCEDFTWGGCNGIVPFWTLEDCQNSCENNTLIQEITQQKKLLKTIDILGKESLKKGFQLRIYDDGSIEKKWVLK